MVDSSEGGFGFMPPIDVSWGGIEFTEAQAEKPSEPRGQYQDPSLPGGTDVDLCLEGQQISSEWPVNPDDITSLTAEQAEELIAANQDGLSLNGLTTLTPDVADVLARVPGDLSLNGLSTLSTEAAVALARHGGFALALNGLTALSDAAAEALSHYDGELILNGLSSLSDVAAASLADRLPQSSEDAVNAGQTLSSPPTGGNDSEDDTTAKAGTMLWDVAKVAGVVGLGVGLFALECLLNIDSSTSDSSSNGFVHCNLCGGHGILRWNFGGKMHQKACANCGGKGYRTSTFRT